MKDPSKIVEELGETKNKKLLDIVNDHEIIDTDNDRIIVFRALSKIHELKSSSKEFTEFQKRIDSSESTEYVKEKNYLESSLTTLRQKKLV